MNEFIVDCKYCHGEGYVKLDQPDLVACDFCSGGGKLAVPWWDRAEALQDDARVQRCDVCGSTDAVTVELWGVYSICARCALERFRRTLALALDTVLAEERAEAVARERAA